MAQSVQGASAPTIFQFRSTEVRTLVIDGEVWFVASDVAKALGYGLTTDMARNLDEDERGMQIVHTPSGDQEMIVINESGLYHAVLKSRKPEAKPFRKWVTSEVLPAIRKTGQYVAQPTPALPPKKAIRSRDDLSFTRRDEKGRLINWHVKHDRSDMWASTFRQGEEFFAEVATLAAHDELAAFHAILYAITSNEFKDYPAQFDGAWGQENGFAHGLARAAITGLRALREGGAAPFEPHATQGRAASAKALPKPRKPKALPAPSVRTIQ